MDELGDVRRTLRVLMSQYCHSLKPPPRAIHIHLLPRQRSWACVERDCAMPTCRDCSHPRRARDCCCCLSVVAQQQQDKQNQKMAATVQRGCPRRFERSHVSAAMTKMLATLLGQDFLGWWT